MPRFSLRSLRSLRSLCASAALIAACAAGWTHTAQAQTSAARRITTPDSVYARAKRLVVNGNGAAGRVLVDSMVAAAEPDTPAYAEALYWRASLAASMSDAERDLQRIIVEYPLSPRSSDALLQLGQLEAARGDRVAAATHLEQYLLENPASPEQGRAGLQLVRMSFEQNDARRGCIALTRALNAVPSDEVEMRNQLQYYSPRCANVDTTTPPTAAPGAAKVAAKAAAKTTAKTTAKTVGKTTHAASPAAPATVENDSVEPAPETGGRFTLQVAAYSSRVDADALAKKLKKRGLDTRVTAAGKLFRVRIGHYPTRAAATAAAAQLKAKKIDAFVTDTGKDESK